MVSHIWQNTKPCVSTGVSRSLKPWVTFHLAQKFGATLLFNIAGFMFYEVEWDSGALFVNLCLAFKLRPCLSHHLEVQGLVMMWIPVAPVEKC